MKKAPRLLTAAVLAVLLTVVSIGLLVGGRRGRRRKRRNLDWPLSLSARRFAY